MKNVVCFFISKNDIKTNCLVFFPHVVFHFSNKVFRVFEVHLRTELFIIVDDYILHNPKHLPISTLFFYALRVLW